MADARVHFASPGVIISVPHGSLLLDAARHAGVAVDAPCGGVGRCGRCRLIAHGALSPLTEDERSLLPAGEIAAGMRLACRARVMGEVHVGAVTAPGHLRIVEHATVSRPEVEPPYVRGIITDDAGEPLLGVAADIGTTTLALALVDLRNGDQVAHISAPNGQQSYGADVMSRVSAALSGGADGLHSAVVAEIERLAEMLVARIGATPAHVHEFSVVANTAMRALLLGEDVRPLAAAPYTGALVSSKTVDGAAIGMKTFDAPVYVAPGVSAFIGGDIVAGLLASGITRAETPKLFLDLGTNGEIVLLGGGHIVAASAAAGPALEGASIEMGMRAEPGAIERVRNDAGTLIAETIDGAPPRGICGSGLLDLVAAMLEVGALDQSGRITAEPHHAWVSRVRERGDQRVFDVTRSGGVVLTQRDVRELQLAKGAIATAVDMLLENAGLAPDAVAEMIVAGGFGLHVRGEALARIGMIPAPLAGRLDFVGNAALAGAVALLVSAETRAHADALAAEIQTIGLADDSAFQGRFLAALAFPQVR
ncbi:MAG: DUF4445 domain-containing protein [Coriobacteriia bacterium]|nr:DUF4445 domain-containing protein [Coriobacteriia bacterium]MBN2821766.1 DUF4445 domain-containing protein [Coriobacteriia bacterium]